MIALSLPWPAKILWPNGRGHWAAKAAATKIARTAAWALTLEAIGRHKPTWQRVKLSWTFHPKTANRVDDDNAAASAKAYRDGIAQALGIDDQNFTATYEIGSPIKGGLVRVTLEEAK